MSFDPLTAAFDLGKMAIDKIWPDPIRRAEELRKLKELEQNGDLAQLNAHVQLMLGQLEVNKAEAKHKSIFVAGWRPGVGWVGAIGLAYQFILYPLLIWLWAILQVKGIVPDGLEAPRIFNTEGLWVLISAMLGVGGMRSFDKSRKVQTDSIK